MVARREDQTRPELSTESPEARIGGGDGREERNMGRSIAGATDIIALALPTASRQRAGQHNATSPVRALTQIQGGAMIIVIEV